MTDMASYRRDTVKDYFSAQSTYWDALYDETSKKNFLHYELTRRKEIVFQLVDGIGRDNLRTALDLGCGAGNYLVPLAQMGLDTVGTDISEDMLGLAREKLDALNDVKATLVQADCYNLPMQDHEFDLVLAIGLLEYLDNPDAALREIRRVMSSKGHAIVTLPNLYKLRNLLNPYYYLVRIWSYFFKRPSRKKAAPSPEEFGFNKSESSRFSLPKARKLIESCGFRILDVRSGCFGPFSLWKVTYLGGRETAARTSRVFENLQQYAPFGFLKFFTNRWVILIKPSDTE